jgi:hypothetical protein
MSNVTTHSIFKQASIIHIALCLGTTIVVGILYTLRVRSGDGIATEPSLNIFELLVPILAILSFGVAYYLGKSRYKKMDPKLSITAKMEVWRANNIMIWAALEGSAFFAGISFYLTGHTNLILYALMIGVLLIYFRPLKSRAAEELKLTPEQADQLD